MNEKDTENPSSGGFHKNKLIRKHSISEHSPEDLQIFEKMIDLLSRDVYMEVGILTGLTDIKEFEKITITIFVFLWEDRPLRKKDVLPSRVLHKILIQQVFSYLKKTGNQKRIEYLRNTLTVNPSWYIPILKSRIYFTTPNSFINSPSKN